MDHQERLYMASLIAKKIRGDISAAEAETLDRWRHASARNEALYNEVADERSLAESLYYIQSKDHDKAYRQLRERMGMGRGRTIAKAIWYRRIAAAVALLLLAGGGIWTYRTLQKDGTGTSIQQVDNDIAAAGQRAVLTLADGSKIVLDTAGNGLLARQAGVSVTKTADGQLVYEILRHAPQARASDKRQPKAGVADWRASVTRDPATYNTIQTPNGGYYTLTLPDGTLAWLNAGSTLRYPVRFSGAERRIYLEGEAYFEVRADKQRPFVVATADQDVKVLGTEFNISAYKGEAVETTLLSGSVRVAEQTKGRDYLLHPGQQAVQQQGIVTVLDVETAEYVGWKDNLFVFNNTPLSRIMRQLSHWYDVEASIAADLPNERFYAEIPRDVSLSQILTALEESSDVKFKREGRRIAAMK